MSTIINVATTATILGIAIYLTKKIENAILRHSMISNFSRYGELSEHILAAPSDDRAYFIRDNALWLVPLMDDVPIKSSARPVDLIDADMQKVEEAAIAVEMLNRFKPEFIESDDENGDER